MSACCVSWLSSGLRWSKRWPLNTNRTQCPMHPSLPNELSSSIVLHGVFERRSTAPGAAPDCDVLSNVSEKASQAAKRSPLNRQNHFPSKTWWQLREVEMTNSYWKQMLGTVGQSCIFEIFLELICGYKMTSVIGILAQLHTQMILFIFFLFTRTFETWSMDAKGRKNKQDDAKNDAWKIKSAQLDRN